LSFTCRAADGPVAGNDPKPTSASRRGTKGIVKLKATTARVRRDTAEAPFQRPGAVNSSISNACLAGEPRFIVAKDADERDPDLRTTGNKGNVGLNPVNFRRKQRL
jgi:hypothetical protein